MSDAEGRDPHEHVSPGDPEYGGFRIRELWMVVAVDPADDQEGVAVVAEGQARRFMLLPGPALASDERRALHLREWAQWIADRTGQPLRLLHLKAVEADEITKREDA